MKPVIDLTKEYGLVLEAAAQRVHTRSAHGKPCGKRREDQRHCRHQRGATERRLICMDDLTNAEKVWENISYSSIMSVEDEKMELLFHQKKLDVDMLKSAFDFMKEGGIDVTPLKELIAECIDEEKIIIPCGSVCPDLQCG